MSRLVSIFVAALLLPAVTAVAQWAPVKSEMRETTEIVKDGVVVKAEVREGVFYRTSDGSTLRHWTSKNGTQMPGQGDLLDNHRLVTYKLDYKARTAIQGRYSLPEPLRQDMYKGVVSVGQSSTQSIPCTLIPVDVQLLGQPSQRAGNACVSVPNGLMLRQETNITDTEGKHIHSVFELYDIHLNAVPDPKEFDVDQGFLVSRPDSTLPAPTLDQR